MITKFRIEAKNQDKQSLIENLMRAADQLMRLRPSRDTPEGEWECTQDVITGSPGNYSGRMVFVFHENGAM